MRYPVTLTRDDNGSILATFPDVPQAVTYGATKEEALTRAVDALLTVFDTLMKNKQDIPAPSNRSGLSVRVPTLEAAKLELYRHMRTAGVGKAELGRRLHWHLPQVDRVINVRHGSQLDQLEAAFEALGKHVDLVIRDATPQSRHTGSRSKISVPRSASARKRVRVHGTVRASADNRAPKTAKKR